MNVEVYLFGNLGNGYTQYIDDDSRTLFKSVAAKSKANSQLIIHRNDTLMYYIYIRKLYNSESSNNRYLGICYALNNRFIRNIEGLFSIFEGTITIIASRGHLLEYTNSGNIIASVGKLYNVKSEYAHLSAYLKTELASFMADQNDTLPPLDYSINTSEVKTFKFTDNKQDILTASSTYNTIFIFKDEYYENEESRSYSSTLFRLNKENINLKEANAKLSRQKKQIKAVAWLSFIICIGVVIFFFIIQDKNIYINRLNAKIESLHYDINTLEQEKNKLQNDLNTTESNLRITRDNLQTANRKIESLHYDINTLKQDRSKLQSDLRMTKKSLQTATINLNALSDAINQKDAEISKKKETIRELQKVEDEYKNNLSKMPLIIIGTQVANVNDRGKVETLYGNYIYSNRTMYLKPKIRYIGVTSGKKTIYTRLYNPSGTLSAASSDEVKINTGKNEVELSGRGSASKGHWSAGVYRYEFYCDGICIGSHTFTVY